MLWSTLGLASFCIFAPVAHAWHVVFYTDLTCNNFLQAFSGQSVTTCGNLDNPGAESYHWDNGGEAFELHLHPEADCGGEGKQIRRNRNCDNAGFKIKSFKVTVREPAPLHEASRESRGTPYTAPS